jgi:hypothetical protein
MNQSSVIIKREKAEEKEESKSIKKQKVDQNGEENSKSNFEIPIVSNKRNVHKTFKTGFLDDFFKPEGICLELGEKKKKYLPWDERYSQ